MTSDINTLGALLLIILLGGLIACAAKIALDGEENDH